MGAPAASAEQGGIRLATVRRTARSIAPREAPDGDVRRQDAAVVVVIAEQLSQRSQRRPADADVIELAAGVANRIPDAVELVGLGEGVVDVVVLSAKAL